MVTVVVNRVEKIKHFEMVQQLTDVSKEQLLCSRQTTCRYSVEQGSI